MILPRQLSSVGLAILVSAFMAMSGCASRPLPAPPRDVEDVAQLPHFPEVRGWGDGYSPVLQKSLAELARQKKQRHDAGESVKAAIDILNLSGGGPDGAFGAGFLCGWTAHGDRPEFDVVSGISTGALIAPFAFLGPRCDPALKTVYTTVSTRDLISDRGIIGLLAGESAADTEPLMRLIEKHVDRAVIEAVAAEHARGRRLFIGTTNLDAQRPVVWDMGAIASSRHPEAPNLFRRVMVASASIPVVFPPVFFEVAANGTRYSEMHVDGAATRQVFHHGVSIDYQKLMANPNVSRAPVPRRVYVLRNSLVRPEWEQVSPRVIPIGGRAIMTLLKSSASGDLHRIYGLCTIQGMEFHFACIPDEYEPRGRELFDREEMGRLFQIGYEQASRGYRWQRVPPDVARGEEP